MHPRVEAAFVLLDKATGPLRNMGRQARSTERDFGALGRRMDANEKAMRSSRRESDTLGASIRKLGQTLQGLGKILGLLKIPALVAALGLATQAVVALGAGVTSLLGPLSDFGALIGPMPALIGGVVGAMMTWKIAFKDIGKAMGGNKKALEGLSPQARDFVTVLKGMQPVMNEIRTAAQQGLFPGLSKALQELRAGVPTVTRLFARMGRQLGRQAQGWARMLTGRGMLADLGMLGNQGTTLIGRLSRSLRLIFRAFVDIGIAARPFTEWLSKTIQGWAKYAAASARAGRETGTLRAWFERARGSLELFGRIFSNVWGTLRGIAQASRPLAKWILESTERITGAQKAWAQGTAGQTRMRRFFMDMRAPLSELAGLTSDLVKALFRIGTSPGMTNLVRTLRRAVGPLERSVTAITGAFGPALVEALVAVARLIEQLTGATGPMTMFLNAVTGIVKGFAWMLENVPGLTNVLTALFSVVALNKFIARLGVARGLMGGFGGGGFFGGRGGRGGKGGPGVITTGPLAGMTGDDPLGKKGGRGGLLRGAGGLARGAAKFAGPAMAVMAAFDFATARGNVLERGASALNAGTFGLSGALGLGRGRKSREENEAEGFGAADKFLARTGTKMGGEAQFRAMQRRIATLQRNLDARSFPSRTTGSFGPGDLKPTLTGDARERAQAQKAALTGQVQAAMGGMVGARLAGTQEAFAMRGGGAKARGALGADIARDFAAVGPMGRKALAASIAQWQGELAKGSKSQRRTAREMARAVEGQYERMGKKVEVVNGRVLFGTQREWAGIKDALSSNAERARQEVSGAFTDIQRQAVGSLKAMGYSGREAWAIVRVHEGQATGKGGGAYSYRKETGARGMRIKGAGLSDTVQVGPNHWAAPGELIVNRHTEKRVRAKYGVDLGREVAGESRPHSAPEQGYGLGGRQAFRTGGRAGAGGATGTSTLAVAQTLAQMFGLNITSTYRTPEQNRAVGGVEGSWHTRGTPGNPGAADLVGSGKNMQAALAYVRRYNPAEAMIHNVGSGLHLHIAGIGVGGAAPGGGGAGGILAQLISLAAPGSGIGGAPGAMSRAATGAMARGLEQKINDEIGGGAGAAGAAPKGQVRTWLAKALRLTGMFSAANLNALYGRAMQESGGDPSIVNTWDSNAKAGTPSIGLLQTIEPTFRAHMMPGMGNIRNPVHNAVAAIRYMMSRYGHIVGPGGGGYEMGGRVPFGGWYGDGGDFVATRPQMIGVGDGGRERVTIGPAGGGRGGVKIGTIKIENHRPGDIRRQLREEIEQAFNELADIAGVAGDDNVEGLV